MKGLFSVRGGESRYDKLGHAVTTTVVEPWLRRRAGGHPFEPLGDTVRVNLGTPLEFVRHWA